MRLIWILNLLGRSPNQGKRKGNNIIKRKHRRVLQRSLDSD